MPRLWAYTAAICKNHDLLTFAVGGMEGHLHLLFRLPPTVPLADAVALVKSNSSKWLKERRKSFAWQEGYGAFSVSSSNISTVIKYIDNQEAHHRKISFEDEFITLLKKHEIPLIRNTYSVSVAAYGARISGCYRYPGLPHLG